jgi:hypothetical protein
MAVFVFLRFSFVVLVFITPSCLSGINMVIIYVIKTHLLKIMVKALKLTASSSNLFSTEGRTEGTNLNYNVYFQITKDIQ